MPGKDVKGDLQQRLEKGQYSHEVVVFDFIVQNVCSPQVAADEGMQAAITNKLRVGLALEANSNVLPEHLSLALDFPSAVSVAVRCVATPPRGAKADTVSTTLAAKLAEQGAGSVREALAARLAVVEGLQIASGRTLQVEDVKAPVVVPANWPKVRLDKKVPNSLFTLYENLSVLDDARSIEGVPGNEDTELVAQEVTWSLQRTTEVFKDPKLGHVFVLLVSSLHKQDHRSCNSWAGSLAPSVLQFILADSPMKTRICKSALGVARQEWQIYALHCKMCVAIAIVACHMREHWSNSFTVDDKAFLGEAIEKMGWWPSLTVREARCLWDRSTCRYVLVDGLVQNKATSGSALSYLSRCPRDIVCSRFKAPWHTSPVQASFFYLYRSFVAHSNCKSTEELCDCLARAYTHPSSDFASALRAFMQDPNVTDRLKRDFLVAIISACRRLQSANTMKAKAKKVDDEHRPPCTDQVELVVLEAILKDFIAQGSTISQGQKNSAAKDAKQCELAKTFEALLLLSSNDNLWQWAQELHNTDRQTANAARRFLNVVACNHISSVISATAGNGRSFRYEDSKSKALLGGEKMWEHNGRKLGYFSDYLEKSSRPPEEVGQIMYMYIKLDQALGAGSSGRLVQLIEDNSECQAKCFNRLIPGGSFLRQAVIKDICRGLREQSLKIKEIDSLMNYVGFFSLTFQSFLGHDTAMADMQSCFKGAGSSELVFPLLEAVLKLLSLQREQACHSVNEVISGVCAQICNDPPTAQLFSQVVREVQERNCQEASDGFSPVHLRDCAKELRRVSQVIQYKQSHGVSKSLQSDMDRVIQSLLKRTPPKTWVSSFRSLDTVIFALEYVGKEDLQLAYRKFEEECMNPRQDQLVDLVRCVKKIYTHPLAGTTIGLTPDTDIHALIMNNAPKLDHTVMWHGIAFGPSDWQNVLKIAAAAAEAMRQRYGVIMLPHHAQVIALLMFGFRLCGAGSGGAGFRGLPRALLARVGTGEGKSMIIGMLAAFAAMKGLRAHVVNDDKLLTQRDFTANQQLFKALNVSASNNPADLSNQACSIVYCTGDDVEGSCLALLTTGKIEQYEESLREAVLIVDEVDGMVFDKGVASSKLFEDREFSDMVNNWMAKLSLEGSISKDWDDFRSMGEGSAALQEEVETAYREAAEKEEGYDYTKRGDELYMMDTRTNKIAEHGWALWLEILKSQRTVPPGFVHYKYTKAVLCRLQCFMSYSCIVGLTGSLGQRAEQAYLAEHYQAVTFNVPFFLDTCQANSALQGKKAPMHIGEKEPFNTLQDQDRAVVSLAVSKCTEVPVLVIARDPEDVDCLAKDIEAELNKRYGEDPSVDVKLEINGTENTEASNKGCADTEPAGAEAAHRIIKLLHNPRNPKEFVELVCCTTEPVCSKSSGGPRGERQAWPITLTTAEGGRGHDYRVTDPAIDERGGLLLILTWVPSSEREWVQFLGRTGRQDHAGQYAVLLSLEDKEVAAACGMRQPSETLVQAMLRYSDIETSKMFQGFNDEIAKGRLMHLLTSKYWTNYKEDNTTKRQDWEWKKLCEDYLQMSSTDAIQIRFDGIIPPEVRLVVSADEVHYGGDWKPRRQPTPRNIPHPGDPGCLDSEVAHAKRPLAGTGAKGTAGASGPADHTYHIRRIMFFGMQRRVLCAPDSQAEIPLMALCNVLLLRKLLSLPEKETTVSLHELIKRVSTLLVDLHSGAHVDGDPRSAETQQALHRAVEMLPCFQYPLELNNKFSGPRDFEWKRQLSVFNLLDISILHGWVVTPLDTQAYSVVAPHSYNDLQHRMAQSPGACLHSEARGSRPARSWFSKDDHVIDEAPIIQRFLERTASQLTIEGIKGLHQAMDDRELAVFMRHRTFFTVLRNKDQLYLLITNPGFMQTDVVWERLAAMDDKTGYLSGDFTSLGIAMLGTTARAADKHRASKLSRGPRLQAGGSAGGLCEIRCLRCGISNQFPAPAPGMRRPPTLRCGACGEVQTLEHSAERGKEGAGSCLVRTQKVFSPRLSW